MKIIGIIPSRMASSRLPNKPLKIISGMPMIGHCYYRTKLALGAENTYVATCDDEISEYINGINGQSIMTSIDHTRATTRTAEAVKLIEDLNGYKVDVVIMVQGDEPLTSPDLIKLLVDSFSDSNVEIANVMSRIYTKEKFFDKNNVKVVVDNNDYALYFSREAIPSSWRGFDGVNMYMQTGLIGFKRNALLKFIETPESSLEKVESIDMNRVLENGGKIKMIPVETPTIGVDIESDLTESERMMDHDPIYRLYR